MTSRRKHNYINKYNRVVNQSVNFRISKNSEQFFHQLTGKEKYKTELWNYALLKEAPNLSFDIVINRIVYPLRVEYYKSGSFSKNSLNELINLYNFGLVSEDFINLFLEQYYLYFDTRKKTVSIKIFNDNGSSVDLKELYISEKKLSDFTFENVCERSKYLVFDVCKVINILKKIFKDYEDNALIMKTNLLLCVVEDHTPDFIMKNTPSDEDIDKLNKCMLNLPIEEGKRLELIINQNLYTLLSNKGLLAMALFHLRYEWRKL